MQVNAPMLPADLEHQLTNGSSQLVRLDARHFEFLGLNIGERFVITFDPVNGDAIDVVCLTGAVEHNEMA